MIVTAGELLVEFISQKEGCGLQLASNFTGPHPSGAPAIFLSQAALMGAQTKIFGGVGSDAFGQLILNRLQKNGVNTGSVVQHNSKTTGTAFVSYFSDRNRIFIFHVNGTAAESFNVEHVPEGPQTLHISGSSLGNPNIRKNILSLCELTSNNSSKTRLLSMT